VTHPKNWGEPKTILRENYSLQWQARCQKRPETILHKSNRANLVLYRKLCDANTFRQAFLHAALQANSNNTESHKSAERVHSPWDDTCFATKRKDWRATVDRVKIINRKQIRTAQKNMKFKAVPPSHTFSAPHTTNQGGYPPLRLTATQILDHNN